jgi:hypothetical protein
MPPTLSPELTRSVPALARSLVAASRDRRLYPPVLPALGAFAAGSVGHLDKIGQRQDGRGDFSPAVVEAVDRRAAEIDPLHDMQNDD